MTPTLSIILSVVGVVGVLAILLFGELRRAPILHAEDTKRLNTLERSFQEIPDFNVYYNDDPDLEDELGFVPVGWNIRFSCVCAEDVMIHAPTFRSCVDTWIEYMSDEKAKERGEMA